MPIEVLVMTTAGASTHLVQLTEKSQAFAIPIDAEPSDVALDPNAWVFMRSSIARQPQPLF
jgi:hypothetical protein